MQLARRARRIRLVQHGDEVAPRRADRHHNGADRVGRSLESRLDRTAIALAFVLAHPSEPVAILGSQKPDRLRAATSALKVTLTRDDVYTLIEASEGEALP